MIILWPYWTSTATSLVSQPSWVSCILSSVIMIVMSVCMYSLDRTKQGCQISCCANSCSQHAPQNKLNRPNCPNPTNFSTTPLSFDAPLQRTPANICINLILPETTFPGLHFYRWQYMGSSASFRSVLSESRRRQPISCRARNRF